MRVRRAMLNYERAGMWQGRIDMDEHKKRVEAYERRRRIAAARDRAARELGAMHELVQALDGELAEATEALVGLVYKHYSDPLTEVA